MKPTIRKHGDEWECISFYEGKEQLSVTGKTPKEAFETWDRVFNECVAMMDEFMEAFRK